MKTFRQYLMETGANTSWEDESGAKLTLSDIESMTSHLPEEDIPVGEIAHMGLHNKHPDVMKDRIQQVKLDKPIYIYGNRLLDGNHRLARAIQDGATHIRGKRFDNSHVSPEHHEILGRLFR